MVRTASAAKRTQVAITATNFARHRPRSHLDTCRANIVVSWLMHQYMPFAKTPYDIKIDDLGVRHFRLSFKILIIFAQRGLTASSGRFFAKKQSITPGWWLGHKRF